MADFRRWVTALAVLALFAGLAGAQTGSTLGQMVCNSVAQVTPTLRSEGITELVGDIVITCTGGNYVPIGAAIPQANLIVSLTAPVTSRLQSASNGRSEALLLIDEPNSGLYAPVAGFGPAAPFNVCTAIDGSCLEYAAATTGALTPGGTAIPITVASASASTLTPGYNVFMGVESTNQIAFNGIPVLPPVTSGVQRVYRITNIRVNATAAGASVVSGVQPVYAYLSSSGPSSLPVSNAALTVGFVQTSLTLSVTNDKGKPTSSSVANFTQCNGVTLGNVALLNYSENFPAAFKTRVGINPVTGQYASPITTTGGVNYSYGGTVSTIAGGTYTQNVPGTLYNSESGFILPTGPSSFVAGLADTGTRFQAVFANLPSGAKIYVSRYNVTGFTTSALGSTTPGVATTTLVQPSLAGLTTGGAGGDYSAFAYSGGATTTGNVDVVQLSPDSTGAATAVWEVLNTNSYGNETYSFGVYISYTPDLTNNKPTPGNAATVTLSYAPLTSTTTTRIPRFIAGSASTAQPLLNISKCQTVLLFPYLTSTGGFDTGIAISNTSMDPLTNPTATQTSTGSCSLNFYGVNAPTGTIAPLGPIPPGDGSDATKFAFQLSSVAPNFTGYLFAVCDFQFAHGFAFISDVGVRNLAMGYLALIVNNSIQLNQRAGGSNAYAAEALSQ